MNYEEKYKQALEIARELHDNHSLGEPPTWKTCEEIFPELKESEDEKIRKEITEFLKKASGGFLDTTTHCKTFGKWLAWLEKQGGKVDVLDDFPTEFERQISHLIASSINKEWEYKKDFVKYTANALLQYAKNELEKQGEQKPTPKFKIGDTIHKIGESTVFPRTIEKIEDGDYVCNNSHSFVNIKFQDDYELVEQKSAWNEKDEKELEQLLDTLHANGYESFDTWLKSLKDRVQSQSKQEWSKEDEEMYNEVLTDIIYTKNNMKTKGCLELSKRAMKAFNWFSKRYKSLKPQSTWKPSEEQMEALWNIIPHIVNSEEDVDTITELSTLYDELKKL